jgi:glycosyltransferase involved in cell wall biosynthesis
MGRSTTLKRIGIADHTSAGWAAGASYTRMLVHSLSAACAASGVELYLFTQDPDRHVYELPLKVIQLNSSKRLSGARSLRQLLGSSDEAGALPGETRLRHLLRRNDGSDLFLAARARNVSVLLPLLDLPPWKLPYGTVGWIPDFQHVHLPELFSAKERQRRDQTIRRIAQWSTRVMLSSHVAGEHFRTLVPEHQGKARVIPFPSLFAFRTLSGDPGDTQSRFNVPKKFALVANQFWAHKNHLAVIEALAALRESSVTVPVVMIGRPADNKDQHNRNLSRIFQAIAERCLSGQVIVLGEVSYEDLVDLMRTAAVVIQPSRFEGWSTIVQDAKALGRPLLCSDIAVHREQAPQALGFFGCNRADELSEQLATHWPTLESGPNPNAERNAQAAEAAFARQHGETLLEVCREAAALRCGN